MSKLIFRGIFGFLLLRAVWDFLTGHKQDHTAMLLGWLDRYHSLDLGGRVLNISQSLVIGRIGNGEPTERKAS